MLVLLLTSFAKFAVSTSQVFDDAKARRLLKYKPLWTPEESVKRSLEYWDKRKDV
jgi:nucleoside-diphosphate-sugar epimerase